MEKTTVLNAYMNFKPQTYYYRGQFVASIHEKESWYEIVLSGGMSYLIDGRAMLGVRRG